MNIQVKAHFYLGTIISQKMLFIREADVSSMLVKSKIFQIEAVSISSLDAIVMWADGVWGPTQEHGGVPNGQEDSHPLVQVPGDIAQLPS